MKPDTVQSVFFSPTHTSARIARAIARGTSLKNTKETDLTCDTSCCPIEIADTLAVIAVPVYGGRVAPIALERIRRLRGNGTPAILAVVYGNRDYEDALVELRDTVLAQGFVLVSAGAFIGEHSYSRPDRPVAEGRPDGEDLKTAEDFGKASVRKWNDPISAPFFIKGNTPYKSLKPSAPDAPFTLTDHCTLCEICIGLCPTQAIFVNENGEIDTDKNLCIKCCACVKDCPAEARQYETPFTIYLHQNFSARREPELFL